METSLLRGFSAKVVLESGQPVVDIDTFVSQKIAPKPNTIQDLQPPGIQLEPWLQPRQDLMNRISASPVARPENRTLAMVIGAQIRNVPKSLLRCRRGKPELEHQPPHVGPIQPGAMPEAVMKDKNRSGITNNMPLPAQVLVTTNTTLADDAKMRSGDITRPAHFRRDSLGKVEQLNIKGASDIDGRILVGRLGNRSSATIK